MSSDLTNRPRILHGAFVEYGLSLPPLKVVFQLNPEQLSRNRSITYSVPGWMNEYKRDEDKRLGEEAKKSVPLREFHKQFPSLADLQDAQIAEVKEESISFDIRFDATDALNEGDPLAGQFGIAPQLATLELMVLPKGESFIGQQLRGINADAFSFTAGDKPPMILFIWGRRRVLPVNIDSMNITESEFGPDLTPIRATVAVSLTVIEGPNPISIASRAIKETLALVNLVSAPVTADIVIPG